MSWEVLVIPELLKASVGEWEGVYKLWLEPGVLRSESPTRGSIRSLLDGRYIAYDYDWADQGAAQRGTMLFGRDGGNAWQLAWVDTFHTGLSIMSSTGGPTTDAVVQGSYGGDGEQWGWRTAWTMADADHLVVTAWNITPQGEEAKATEATYERRS
jgi:hypothetical protein